LVYLFCGHLEYTLDIWYILWPFGNLVAIWYISFPFGILCQEKSGNPEPNDKCVCMYVACRVTGLGEFSPNGRLIT
jgi:hypothetical protein